MEGIWMVVEIFKEPLKVLANKIFGSKKNELNEEKIRAIISECLQNHQFNNFAPSRLSELEGIFNIVLENSLIQIDSENMNEKILLEDLLTALEDVLIYPSQEQEAFIFIPPGKLATDPDHVKRLREEIKKKLQEGKRVTISPSGKVNPNDNSKSNIVIPPGKLATDPDHIKRLREEIKKKLQEGKRVTISPSGKVNPNDNSKSNIVIPPGKLASFYWYERDQILYGAEIAAMNKYFPGFTLGIFDDGHLYWRGRLETGIGYGSWDLIIIYDHNHPHNNNFGGSVKIYSLDPDLEEYSHTIPHILRDTNQQVYLCTAHKEDVKVDSVVTTAASNLAWAVKWITVFELWIAGEITIEQFKSHTF